MSDGLFIGLGSPDKDGGVPQTLNLRRANRHGLIAGATGTGKTVTLQTIAEGFSARGVPVFLADNEYSMEIKQKVLYHNAKALYGIH